MMQSLRKLTSTAGLPAVSKTGPVQAAVAVKSAPSPVRSAPSSVKPASSAAKPAPSAARSVAKTVKARAKSVNPTPRRGKKKTLASRSKRVRQGKPLLRKRRYIRKRRGSVMEQQMERLDHSNCYETGYQEGLIAGGEKILQEHLPTDLIIPDITVREAVAAGVNMLSARGLPLLNSEQVYQELEVALREKKPYAFIRLGDGELLTLAQEKVLTLDEIKRAGPFLSYAGVTIPNLAARDEIASCIQVATLVGVPMSRHPHFQPLLFAVLRAHGIEYQKLKYTTSTMNYLLEEQGLLIRLLRDRKILVIGDIAAPLSQALLEQGLQITGVITPVNGYADVPRVVAEAAAYDYDIALVAAGIPAIPIAVHLAGLGGKVTFDFGHLANRMAGLAQPEGIDHRR